MNFNIKKSLPIISLIVALAGGIPGIITSVNYFNRPKINVSFDDKNSFIALLASDNKDHNGKKAIGFYEIKFVGGETPTTVKNVQFFIKIKRNFISSEWVEGKQFSIHTNDFEDKKNCIVFGGTERDIILTDWVDFKNNSINYFIERGKASQFNVMFEFNNSLKEIKDASAWKFIVTDHYNNRQEIVVKHPTTTNMAISDDSAKHVLFDCYLKSPKDVFEILKGANPNYIEINHLKIQQFLKTKYNHTEEWYEK